MDNFIFTTLSKVCKEISRSSYRDVCHDTFPHTDIDTHIRKGNSPMEQLLENMGFELEGDFTPDYSLRVAIRYYMNHRELRTVITSTIPENLRYICYVIYNNNTYFYTLPKGTKIENLEELCICQGRNTIETIVADKEDKIFELLPELRYALYPTQKKSARK